MAAPLVASTRSELEQDSGGRAIGKDEPVRCRTGSLRARRSPTRKRLGLRAATRSLGTRRLHDNRSSPVDVRHFRQIVLWPLQLVPEKDTGRLQRHWEALGGIGRDNAWREVIEEFHCDPEDFRERSYREFVTFLPFVQRFLYGSKVGMDSARREGEPSLRIYRRTDIRKVVITYGDGSSLTFDVGHIDLYFFLDADIALLSFELYIDDIPLERAQDTMFRFGRAYPGFWDATGEGANCPRRVEWLDAQGAVRAVSDYGERRRYLEPVARGLRPARARDRAGWARPPAVLGAVARDLREGLLRGPLLGSSARRRHERHAVPRLRPRARAGRTARRPVLLRARDGRARPVSAPVSAVVRDRPLLPRGAFVDVGPARGRDEPARDRRHRLREAVQALDPSGDGDLPALHASLLVSRGL